MKIKKLRQEKKVSFIKRYQKPVMVIVLLFLFCISAVLFIKLQKENTRKVSVQIPETKTLPPEVKRQLTLSPPTTTFRIPILLYHYVEYVQDKRDTKRQALNITPYTFDQQIKTLKDDGYTFMTTSELGDVLDGKMQLPNKPVILTFDDGHWDLDTDVLPILKKYNVKATAYIIPGFLNGSDFLSDQQLSDVAKSGMIEIGAHTVHHVALRGQPLKKVLSEVGDSKKMLENDLHVSVVSFAYPYGSFDEQAIQVVKDAGFTTAVSTVPGIQLNQNNRYFIYRLRPGARIGQQLLSFLSHNTYSAYGFVANATSGN